MNNNRACSNCLTPDPERGRAWDGRRAYKCKCCGRVWTEGLQGKNKKSNKQRVGYQFANSKGAGHNN